MGQDLECGIVHLPSYRRHRMQSRWSVDMGCTILKNCGYCETAVQPHGTYLYHILPVMWATDMLIPLCPGPLDRKLARNEALWMRKSSPGPQRFQTMKKHCRRATGRKQCIMNEVALKKWVCPGGTKFVKTGGTPLGFQWTCLMRQTLNAIVICFD